MQFVNWNKTNFGFSIKTWPQQFSTQKSHQQINFDFTLRIVSYKHCIDTISKFSQIHVRDFPEIFHLTFHDPEILLHPTQSKLNIFVTKFFISTSLKICDNNVRV